MKHYLIINTSAPFCGSYAQEGIELALALASFEQQVSLLFCQDGCWQLLKNTKADIVFRKDFLRNLHALQLSGVNDVYVNAEDLAERDLSVACCSITVKSITGSEQQQLIQTADVVLTID